MAFGSPLGNLKGFASSRPPLVVFTICLISFAVTTLSLAYFVRTNEAIPNQDIRLDWTTFLNHLSYLDLCVTPNETLLPQRLPNISHLNNEDADNGYSNVSIAVSAGLSLIHQFSTFPHNVTIIAGVLPLGEWSSLCTSEVSVESLNVTLSLPPPSTNASNSNQEICITFSGPRSLLPVSRSPPACSLPKVNGNLVVNARLESRSRLADALGERVDDEWCQAGAVMRMTYHADTNMNVLLTLRDRSLINLHLIHTSYFLFVMAITLVCYALIKGRHKSKSQLSIDKIPLDP